MKSQTGQASIKKSRLNRESLFGLSAVSLPLIGFFCFSFIPMCIAIVTMFVDMDGFQLDSMKWNNFANFKDVFADEKFWLSLRNTFGLLIAQFVSLGIALVTSTFLSQKYRGTKFFTALFFVPYICSSVAITLIFMTMFDYNYGVVNAALVAILGEGARVSWQSEAGPFFLMIFLVILWQAPGYGIVMFNAAFTQVPRTLYEAAALDGAGKTKQFIYITIPSIRPTTFFLMMAGIIAGLQTFDIPQLFVAMFGDAHTGTAGPDNAGLTSTLYAYILKDTDMPKASVISLFLFVVIMLLTIINFRAERRHDDD